MMAARSLVTDGDFDLADDYADPANPVFDGKLECGLHALPGRGGALYPAHDVGLPLLASPAFALASWVTDAAAARMPRVLARARLNRWTLLRQLVSLGMIAVACWLAGLMADAGPLAGAGPRASAAWAALWTVSPPVLGPAFAFFTEVPTALAVLWLFLETRRPEGGAARWALRGLVAGGLVLIHARNVALAAALSALLLVRAPAGRRARAVFAAGVLAALAARTWVTWRFWGTLLTTPHASPEAVSPGRALAEMASRLLAWCFDAEHGLLPWAPVYAALLAGLVLLRRRYPALLRDIAWVTVPYLLTVMAPFINRHGWRGGWSPAARFLVPVAPLLGLAVLQALLSSSRWLSGALVAAQCALDGLYWARPQLLWEDGDGQGKLLEAVGGAVQAPAWWPSWTWPPSDLAPAVAVALALWAAVTVLLLRTSRSP